MIRHFYLMRHGETVWNQQRRTQGITDIPLDNAGVIQINKFAGTIGKAMPNVKTVFSSPLLRAAQTAEILAGALGAEIITTPDLVEFAFGIWEGRTFYDLDIEYGTGMKQWRIDPSKCDIPEAEGFEAFAARCSEFFNRLKEFAGDALIISHSMVIKQMTRLALKTDYTKFHEYATTNGQILTLVYDAQTGLFDLDKGFEL